MRFILSSAPTSKPFNSPRVGGFEKLIIPLLFPRLVYISPSLFKGFELGWISF